MALILISGLRGGVGTTSLAANMAIGLAAQGTPCVVLSFSPASTLGLHFGLDPRQPLPDFDAPAAATGPVHGVRLVDASVQARSGDLAEGLGSGDLSFEGNQVFVADLSGTGPSVADQLRPYADLEVCVFTPSAECLYSLPAALEALPPEALFLLNRCDDARRLGRHAANFAQELLGERLVAAIAADEAVPESAAMMQPLLRHAPASAALADIMAFAGRISQLRTSTEASAPASVLSSKSNAA